MAWTWRRTHFWRGEGEIHPLPRSHILAKRVGAEGNQMKICTKLAESIDYIFTKVGESLVCV